MLKKHNSTTSMCSHQWIPVEYEAGCRRFHNHSMTMDWSSNMINAHKIHVTKLYCPKCNSFCNVPSSASDK